jgi:small redox-active disulfide protein 2
MKLEKSYFYSIQQILNEDKMNTIKVYGSGCSNCVKLETMCKEVVQELGMQANVQKVTDIQEIMKTGIMSTPGLEINGKMVSSGKLPVKATLVQWIVNALAEAESK